MDPTDLGYVSLRHSFEAPLYLALCGSLNPRFGNMKCDMCDYLDGHDIERAKVCRTPALVIDVLLVVDLGLKTHQGWQG